MSQQEIVAIAAVADNGVIGADGDIPWRLPGDLPRLKRLTMGHVLLMGRRTYDTLGRPLPGRTTIVLTRDPDWSAEGVLVAHDLDTALDLAAEPAPDRIVWVFGGGEIYRLAWDRIDRLELTEVHATPAGDTTFPAVEPDRWVATGREEHEGFDFVTYVRR
ncbi:dihydrofolate reductase [Raineyella antarctica]|uniref:Dihydrofolate reductase n=1 Tax=Raineyella antarctica TaxID=1577474 RepID=A0A1G6H489_9ACTN|nr:dihydrofolate reductase [Raineyella antarctica]SDB88898.1 dihydrofolate reductase [Raineyella antarctica]